MLRSNMSVTLLLSLQTLGTANMATDKQSTKSFSIRNAQTIEKVNTLMNELNIDNNELINRAIELMPLYELIKTKGLTVEQVIDRINTDVNVTTIVKTVRKGANNEPFNVLMNKIMDYNESCKSKDFKILLAPTVFYKVIGGNPKSIKELFDKEIETIDSHNKKHGIDKDSNRKLAKKVDTDLYTWIKKTVGFN